MTDNPRNFSPDPQSPNTPSPDRLAQAHQLLRALIETPLTPIVPYPGYLYPPRLGIIHLLAWITVAAALFGIQKTLRFGESPFSFLTVFMMFFTIFRAAGLVGVGILINAKRLQIPGRFQPGHWLLLYLSLTTLERLAFNISMKFNPLGFFRYPIALVSVSGSVFQIIACFWIASRIPEHGRWKKCFKYWAWIIISDKLLFLMFFIYGIYTGLLVGLAYSVDSSQRTFGYCCNNQSKSKMPT